MNSNGWKNSGLPVALRMRLQGIQQADLNNVYEERRGLARRNAAARTITNTLRRRIGQRNYGTIHTRNPTRIQTQRLARWNYISRESPTWFGPGVGRSQVGLANNLTTMFRVQSEASRRRKGTWLASTYKKSRYG